MTTEVITPTTNYELDPAFPNLAGINRFERAQNILKNARNIKKVGANQWTVRSQSSKSVYTVTRENETYKCNCPDCILHQCECKHIIAVKQYLGEVETRVAHSKTQKDWSTYNLGQMNEAELFDTYLKELAGTIQTEQHAGRGRHSLPVSDKVYCAVKKVADMKSLRRTQGTLNKAEENGDIENSMHFNSVGGFLKDEKTTQILLKLIRLSATPLKTIEQNFSVDSSGFQTTSFGDWMGEKWGDKRMHTWLTLHIITGNKTNVVTDCIVTAKDGEGSGDVNNFADLVIQTAGIFDVEKVMADAAYCCRDNFDAVNSVGAEAFLYFKKNTNGCAKGCPAWTESFVKFMTDHKSYMEDYRERNNAETTFGAIKEKFGETLKNKTFTGQVNELLCKVLAYNLTVLVGATFTHDAKVNF